MSAGSLDAPKALLTPRQLEVLELMAKGLTNKEIGGVLEISPGTAKVHVAAVIQALDVTNRTEATNRLHELGIGSGNNEADQEFTVPGFGSRPAIAVLPFDNFSNDRAHEFLADGIVDDLITSLAGWRWYPVIARNSTFAYKGKAMDVREVSRALGAGYVIEGSVRAAGGRVRVKVQVLDGSTAEHVWAERYDRDLADVFDVTDEIVASIVASVGPALARIGGLRVLSHKTDQLDAWANMQRAYVHAAENRLSGFLAAQACLDRATELDPKLAVAWALSSYCQFHLFHFGYRDDAADPATRLAEVARKLTELDTTDPFTPLGIGLHLILKGDHESAVAAMRRAVELGPSLTYAVWGMAIAEGANGNPEQALAWLDRMIRLSPLDPLRAPAHLNRGLFLIGLGRVQEAEDAFKQGIQAGPELPYPHSALAIFHGLRDEHEEAQALIARMREIEPRYSTLRSIRVFMPPEQHEGMRSMLALVGLDNEPDY